jgi:ABC-type polysaccharide/polyol phosphate transport system ATPase subunit
MIPSIKVHELSKCYRIGRGLPSLFAILGRQYRSHPERYHWAVKDVNFELQPGEALGIIGPNGAGKTTILKLLSLVTKPTSGEIYMNGRFSALIELGAGFHPELTGRENIYLNGAILGMRKQEIKERFDQIVDFAGIDQYLDTPVKRYSSGMHARLGFSVAAFVDPEILLVDEVLAVGDTAFQMKCHARMDELRAKGTSLIFVSHNMEAIRRVCNLGMVMYRGQAIYHGPVAEAVVAYSDAVRGAAREAKQPVPEEGGLSQRVMTFDAEIEKVSLLDSFGRPVSVLQSGSEAVIALDIHFKKAVEQPVFGLVVRTPSGQRIYVTTTRWQDIQTPNFSAGERCRVEHRLNLHLVDGTYEFGVDVAAADLSHYLDRIERAMSFHVVGPGEGKAKGLVNLDATISVNSQVLSPNGSLE